MRKKHYRSALCMALLLVVPGVLLASPIQSSSAHTAPAATSDTMLTAAHTALAKHQGATVIGIESEMDGAYWEVKLASADGKRMQWHVSADGSRVDGGPYAAHQSARSQNKWKHRIQAAKLDYQQAYAAIHKARPGRLVELDLDDHDGAIVWEATVMVQGQEYEVRINAKDGRVSKNELD